MAESNLNEGIFDVSKDNALSRLFPKGFELVIQFRCRTKECLRIP